MRARIRDFIAKVIGVDSCCLKHEFMFVEYTTKITFSFSVLNIWKLSSSFFRFLKLEIYPIPNQYVAWIFFVWLIGFKVELVWEMQNYCRLQKRETWVLILHNANIIRIWNEEQKTRISIPRNVERTMEKTKTSKNDRVYVLPSWVVYSFLWKVPHRKE